MFNFHRLIILRTIIICIASLNIHTAHAANVTVIKTGTLKYRLQGSVISSDLTDKSSNFWPGIVIRYMTSESLNAAVYVNSRTLCSTDRTTAAQNINNIIANAILDANALTFVSTRDNSIIIQCSSTTSIPIRGWEVNIPGTPVPARCSVTAPSEVNFGTVNEGETKSIQVQVPIQCDKAASVRLSLSANSTAGVLTMNGTVIKYGINGTGPSAVINVLPDKTSATNLNFTLSDTGKIAGDKQGYVLLVSEVL